MRILFSVLILILLVVVIIGYIPDVSDQAAGFGDEQKELLQDVAAQNNYLLTLEKNIDIIKRREEELRASAEALAKKGVVTAQQDLSAIQGKIKALEGQRADLNAQLEEAKKPPQAKGKGQRKANRPPNPADQLEQN